MDRIWSWIDHMAWLTLLSGLMLGWLIDWLERQEHRLCLYRRIYWTRLSHMIRTISEVFMFVVDSIYLDARDYIPCFLGRKWHAKAWSKGIVEWSIISFWLVAFEVFESFELMHNMIPLYLFYYGIGPNPNS